MKAMFSSTMEWVRIKNRAKMAVVNNSNTYLRRNSESTTLVLKQRTINMFRAFQSHRRDCDAIH